MSDNQFKPGVAAIIIIAIGLLILILLFIFTKRQIMRLAQKFPTDLSTNHIGYQVPKKIFQKIEKNLNNIQLIKYEPKLLNNNNEYCCDKNLNKYKHIYRMKIVDNLNEFENFLINSDNIGNSNILRRHPDDDIRKYFINLQKQYNYCDQQLINELIDIYLHARYLPEPEFNEIQYNRFMTIMNTLKEQINKFNDDRNDNETISTTSTKTTTTTSPTKLLQRKLIATNV